jgi:cellulose synthase/poly-beta-1,6-N-acetylglucosamine synthase-like glycosyltransferase
VSFDAELEDLQTRIADLSRSVVDDDQRDALADLLGEVLSELWPEEGDEPPGSYEPSSDDRNVAIFMRTDVLVPGGDAEASAGLSRLMDETPLVDVSRLLDAHLVITSDVYLFVDVDRRLGPDDLDPFAPTRES